MIASQMYLRRYEDTAHSFEESKDFVEKGTSNNKLKRRELKTSFYIHTQNFEAAIRSYHATITSRDFKKLGNHNKERWRLLGGWLHVIQKLRNILSSDPIKFRLSKFLNETAIFSKDKSGMNIQVILLQSAFHLMNGKYDQLIDRMEALEKYSRRYLDPEENFRSRRMFQLVKLLVKNDFNAKATRNESAELLAEMSTQSSNIINEAHDIEIVPYELCWEVLLEAAEQSSIGGNQG